MCFNPGDGEGVLEAYVMEKLADALNERFVAAGLDRVVPKKAHTIHAVGEKIYPFRSAGKVSLGVPSEPLQGMVNRADFPCVVGGTRSSHSVERSRVCYDGSPE